jgi:hypothetical protein
VFLSKWLLGDEDFLCGYSTKEFHELVVIEAETQGKNWNINHSNNNNKKKLDKLKGRLVPSRTEFF